MHSTLHYPFAIQEDDTCDCDLQESETVLHLVNDCPHHIEERRPLNMAAARAGVKWPPALIFCVHLQEELDVTTSDFNTYTVAMSHVLVKNTY